MEHHIEAVPALTIALAMAVGMLCQALARHLRIPGIVLLLAAGVLLGPDGAGLVRPESLGEALHILVGFAVAVILFEGGMNLRLSRLRAEAAVIRRLISLGAAITALGGTLAARLFMGWDWPVAVAFGVLVIVTGPTVITPLLRRIRVTSSVETVLEAEGVLIDAIGAVTAAVALPFIVDPSGSFLAGSFMGILTRIGVGVVIGAAAGAIIAALMHYESLIPEGLENVVTLSLVLVLFQGSNWLMAETGIVAVTVAGLMVGNLPTRLTRDLAEFKEQLTVLFIGLLFVLLAADVRIAQVRELGLPALATVACLMFLVRPAGVLLCSLGTKLNWRERVFLSWLAPRGVVAAAVASLFAQSLADAGIPGGEALQALVFSVIALTVLVQGLSGALVAHVLGLRRPHHRGYAILGATELGIALGRLLQEGGEEVVVVDHNSASCNLAQECGLKVIYGHILEERTLLRARLEDRDACIMVTANDGINLLLARRAMSEYGVRAVYVACRNVVSATSPASVHESGAIILFGRPRDLDLWNLLMRRERAHIEQWRLQVPGGKFLDMPSGVALPLVRRRGKKVMPVHDQMEMKEGDVVEVAISRDTEEAHAWLHANGWQPVTPKGEAADAPGEAANGTPAADVRATPPTPG